MFKQNPWQCLVWWVVGVFNGGTVCRRRLLQQGYIRDMVHTNLARIHIHRDRAPCGCCLRLCKILGKVWFGEWTEYSTEVQFVGDDFYSRVTLGVWFTIVPFIETMITISMIGENILRIL